MQWNLIKLRREHKETQEDIAKLLNISLSGYSKKERGVSQFTADEMFYLSNHYDKSIEEIFLPNEYTFGLHYEGSRRENKEVKS